jgi:hypothetical protein
MTLHCNLDLEIFKNNFPTLTGVKDLTPIKVVIYEL